MNKVPDLRFAGFAGEWEEHIFGEIIERKSKNSNKDSIPRVEYEDIIPGIGKLNKDISLKTSNKKGLYFNSDDVLYGKLRPYLKNYLHPQFEGIAVGDFWVLNNKSGVNSFLFYHLQTSKFQSIANTSIGTKMPRSDWNLVSDSRFNHPSIDEQEKIGNLFKKIDSLIEIQECKVSKMGDFKKSMLQKMFPKKDELVPEFSFDGFEGDWDKKQIVDIAEIVGGGTPSTNNAEYWKGDINWFSPSEIGDKIFYNSSLQKITELGLSKSSAKLLPKDNTILFTSRATIGNLGLITEDASTNQGFQNFILKNNIDKYFMYSYLQLLKNEFIKLSTGSTFKEISKKSIESIDIKIPIFEEQEKIGQFFKNLDSQIETEKKLLDSYKMMKKSLLQKLFV